MADPHYWLMKTEPDTFGLEHLIKSKSQTTLWEGVRNYQARNHMLAMQVGDQAFFYHSSCATPAIVGIVDIVQTGLVDKTAFDPKSPYYDPKSTPEKPRWFLVAVKFKKALVAPLSLAALKQNPKLSTMTLLRRGNRLSVMAVSAAEWKAILAMHK